MASRAKDWFAHAECDLEQDRSSPRTGRFEWVCFAAQQAAEKAVKAVFQGRAVHPRINSVKRLLETLPGNPTVDTALIDCATSLDRLYVATRYPHQFDAGKPADYYTRTDSEKAIGCAEIILQFCKDQLSGQVTPN
jgi:HEPN domain-containing protein